MTVVTAIKLIKPSRMKIDSITNEILFTLQDESRIQKRKLKETVSSWNGEKPDFESLIDLDDSGAATVITGPVGSEIAVNKWLWLDQGTKIRWALMSPNWKSKTQPSKFRAGRGAGNVIIAGRRAMQKRGIAPRKGIEPRRWAEILTKQRKKPFQRAITKAIQIGSKNLF